MARTKSAILSPADKKAASASIKTEIKSAKDNLKQLAGIRKEADKAYATAGKAHVAALKENDKAASVAEKSLASLEGKLEALSPAKVEA